MATPSRRRTRRGEGEVTDWPRGLAGYTTTGPPDATPEAEEDRTLNRLRLAARLLGLLRAEGVETAALAAELAAVERLRAGGSRAEAARRVELLLARIDEAHAARPKGHDAGSHPDEGSP
jgi:hypothetical protein